MSSALNDRGYAMAALLVALSVMGIMLSVAMPVWQTWVQREREAELVFRGEQYVQAIGLFSRQTGGFPTSMNALRDGKFIRKLYKDPVTNEDFQPVYLGQIASGAIGAPAAPGGRTGAPGRGLPPPSIAPPAPPGRGAQGAGPIIGVVSRSTAESLRQYNGRGRYNEWLFVSTAATQQAGGGAGGTQTPGARGRQGAPGRGLPGRGAPGRGLFPGQGGRNTPPPARGRF